MNILQCQPSTIELRYTPFISDVVGILFLSKCILTYVQKSEFHSFLVQSTQGTLVPVGIICPSQILIPSHCHVQFVHWLKFVFLLSVPPVAWPRCYSFPRVFLEPRSEFIHSQGTSCYLVGILFLPTRVYALGLAWYFAPFDGLLCLCGRNFIPSKVYLMCQNRNFIPS